MCLCLWSAFVICVCVCVCNCNCNCNCVYDLVLWLWFVFVFVIAIVFVIWFVIVIWFCVCDLVLCLLHVHLSVGSIHFLVHLILLGLKLFSEMFHQLGSYWCYQKALHYIGMIIGSFVVVVKVNSCLPRDWCTYTLC